MTRACGEDHPRLCADARGSFPAGGAEALRDGLRGCRRSALRRAGRARPRLRASPTPRTRTTPTRTRPATIVRCAGWWTSCARARRRGTARASRWGSCSHTALPWRGVRARTALASHMSTLRRARLALSQQVSGCRSLRRGHERAVISPRSSLTKDARPCGHGRVTSLAHAVRVGLRSYDYNPSDAHRLAVRAASAEARDTDKARTPSDRSRGPVGAA